MKKEYLSLEMEIFNLTNDILCDNSGEPKYGNDSTDDWGNDIWGVITNQLF